MERVHIQVAISICEAIKESLRLNLKRTACELHVLWIKNDRRKRERITQNEVVLIICGDAHLAVIFIEAGCTAGLCVEHLPISRFERGIGVHLGLLHVQTR